VGRGELVPAPPSVAAVARGELHPALPLVDEDAQDGEEAVQREEEVEVGERDARHAHVETVNEEVVDERVQQHGEEGAREPADGGRLGISALGASGKRVILDWLTAARERWSSTISASRRTRKNAAARRSSNSGTAPSTLEREQRARRVLPRLHDRSVGTALEEVGTDTDWFAGGHHLVLQRANNLLHLRRRRRRLHGLPSHSFICFPANASSGSVRCNGTVQPQRLLRPAHLLQLE
jgi:hypothetical protein